MKKASLTVLVSLSMLAGAAYAQTEGGVMMSTDPAKAAEVEQHAQALRERQEMQPSMPKHSHKPVRHHRKTMKHSKTMKHRKMRKAAPAGTNQ